MKRIGLLSDTHGCWDDNYLRFFDNCDEIWHAGDIGAPGIIMRLRAFRPLRAVYGNIDGTDVKAMTSGVLRFDIEGLDTMIRHIGGYPGRYERSLAQTLATDPPRLLVCGHSHILKVMFDKRHDMLVINPGAAGQYGQQRVRTLVRFTIADGKAGNLEVIELPRNVLIRQDPD